MARQLDLALLRTFSCVAATGSMTAAAQRLHLTQGAVSQQIRRLEDGLGCILLERDSQGIRLTNSGLRLRAKAEPLLALADEVLRDMGAPPVSGRVRLGVPFDLAGAHLPAILPAFARAYPQVDLELVTASSTGLLADFDAGRLDVALAEMPAGARRGEVLAVDRLVWSGAGAAAAKRPLPLCFVSETCVFRPALFAALQDARIDWRVMFENASMEGAAAVVGGGLAVTAWLASAVPDGLALVETGAGLPPLPDFAICLLGGAGTPAAAALAASLRAAYLER